MKGIACIPYIYLAIFLHFVSTSFMVTFQFNSYHSLLSYDNLLYVVISLICDMSQLKICDFSGKTFKGFEVLQFSLSVTTTQPLSSGEFRKLRYDTVPVKSVSANVSFYTNYSKMPNFELWHTCRKWATCTFGGNVMHVLFTANGGNVFLWYLPYYTMSYPRAAFLKLFSSGDHFH